MSSPRVGRVDLRRSSVCIVLHTLPLRAASKMVYIAISREYIEVQEKVSDVNDR